MCVCAIIAIIWLALSRVCSVSGTGCESARFSCRPFFTVILSSPPRPRVAPPAAAPCSAATGEGDVLDRRRGRRLAGGAVQYDPGARLPEPVGTGPV
ncbi:hypothetical protein PVAP13_5KG089522 [Panicum virgatum]|uniref:Secreted protein n=1 Tax=Panicum virgatum TaxID=38727 RepID=A0A8T0S8W6_PANVG|nr:hypothetical protein PVAP13_5KG089522 [Panicum virgatum]